MSGLPNYSLKEYQGFVVSIKKLAKSKAYGKNFVSAIADELECLLINPYPSKSRDEPLPSKVMIPSGWTLHKLELRFGKGASGQIRLIYLVTEGERLIIPLWIYSHEQFSKRPPDADIKNTILSALEALEDE